MKSQSLIKFPEKLWNLVENKSNDCIKWSSAGDSVLINYSKFEKKYLNNQQRLFKTTKIVSFIRQLNLYGFKKIKQSVSYHEYKHQNFKKGCYHLLKKVTRKYSKCSNLTKKDFDDQGRKQNKVKDKKSSKRRNGQKWIQEKSKLNQNLKRKENMLWPNDVENKSLKAVEFDVQKNISETSFELFTSFNNHFYNFNSIIATSIKQELFYENFFSPFHQPYQMCARKEKQSSTIERNKEMKCNIDSHEKFNFNLFDYFFNASKNSSFDLSFAEDAPIDAYTF